MTETESFLEVVRAEGLIGAIAAGRFAGIKRREDGGKGLDGVFRKAADYSNPVLATLEKEGLIHDS